MMRRALSTSAAGKRIWLDCRDCAGLAPIAAKHLIDQVPGAMPRLCIEPARLR
jgi:hypothetical protein